MTLDQLKPNAAATVVALTSEGAERRRMLDLGILPGTRIEVVMGSPLGDPVAYRVRGSIIALRREQAKQIHIQRREA
ncbi:MAG TPA: FeoA family protein [Chthonomonadales bacterium]|nr:FeoA family protein [Chthonomonadales bacterium]